MTFDPDRVLRIRNLLEQTSSLDVVSTFLKSKEVAHTASSWKAMYETRLLPSLNDGKISEAELLDLLRDTEECGRQHVFLYRVKKKGYAETLIGRERVQRALARVHLDGVLHTPLVLEMPPEPTITDVRWQSATVDLALIAKVVETRSYRSLISERSEARNGHTIYIKEWEEQSQRAVNVARLRREGELELRITSQRNSTKYEQELDRLWEILEPVLHRGDFAEVSLSKAKTKLWAAGTKSRDLVRYVESTLRNDRGAWIRAAVDDPQQSLLEESGIPQGLDAFAQKGKGYCEASNVWFVKQEQGPPSRDIHVLLSGMVNEFAVTAACSATDYDKVLHEIRRHNR